MLRIEMANLKSKREEEIIDRIDWISSKEQVADIFTKEKVPKMCVENLRRMVNDFKGEEREREYVQTDFQFGEQWSKRRTTRQKKEKLLKKAP